MYYDPYGLFGVADLPSVPQGFLDFGAGLGDTLLLGFGDNLRDFFSIDGGINQCSGAYSAGEWAGIASGFFTVAALLVGEQQVRKQQVKNFPTGFIIVLEIG